MKQPVEKTKTREHVYIREKAVRVNPLSSAAARQGMSLLKVDDHYGMEAAVSRLIFSHSPRMIPSRICAGVFPCRLIPYA